MKRVAETHGEQGQMTDRCGWVGIESIYLAYHDEEWGVPEYDSRALWEKLILDGFQAGLSWLTILKKRDNFREAFKGFDPEVIATWGEAEVAELLQNPGIIRHRGKIQATITNAQAYLRIQEIQPFADFLWGYFDHRVEQNRWESQANVPTQDARSLQISKDLKKAGFKFCGPTIVYAFMEASGFMNNHLITCHRHKEVAGMARK